jgi:hypothetical protein
MKIEQVHIYVPNRMGQNTHEARQNVGLQASRLRKARMLRKREAVEVDVVYKIDRATQQREARRARRAS